MTLMSAENLSVRFGATEALSGVSMGISAGEIVTVLGPNGSGKTTLLRALLGIVTPSHGRVTRASGLAIGYVPQRLAIDRAMPITVRRFLSLPHRVDDARAAAALARVGLPGLGGRQMVGLSGGQFQRVLLARALLVQPQLLILDEPTQGLDQPGEAGFYRLIEEVRRETGVAVLMVSHDLHVVMAASDRVICLNRHICCEGTPRVVSNAPEYRALFGLGTQGALALYQHEHDHDHDAVGHAPGHDHGHDHAHLHGHGHSRDHAPDGKPSGGQAGGDTQPQGGSLPHAYPHPHPHHKLAPPSAPPSDPQSTQRRGA